MARKSGKLAAWLSGARPARMPDLGARELEILECLWSRSPASAQDLKGQLSGGRIALSTVQSTLERLHRKQLVDRVKEGRAYRYTPTHSRSQFIGFLLRDIADDVAGGELLPMMSGFAAYVAGENPELDAELSRWLRRKDRRHD